MKPQKMKLVINTHFDSAHKLPKYDGLCANLHGHRWNIRITIFGEVDPITGMVVDFKDVKGIIKELDHNFLNNIVENPTAENLALYLKEYIYERTPVSVKEVIIRLYESPDCYVEV